MIAILVSSYNGEKYISAQLDSLLNQTYTDFKCYIRDDGSSDNTCNIIKEYSLNYPNKVVVLYDEVKHRGPNHSFMWMLSEVDADYYMFCDQDDIWLPDKLKTSYESIQQVEANHNDLPVLIHTDMKIVDNNLSVLSESLYKTMKIKPFFVDRFNFMGVCSCGPGCSMIFNNKAKSVSLNYTNLSDIPMHDWWVAINTVKYGKVEFVPDRTMLYRQHSNNTVGASNVNSNYLLKKIIHLKQTLAPYDKDMIWLRKVGYGSKVKYLFYKLLYYIIRIL